MGEITVAMMRDNLQKVRAEASTCQLKNKTIWCNSRCIAIGIIEV